MSETEIIIDEWRGCYKDGWKGLIVDKAFAHPAKYSRALIREIYAHVIAEQWVSVGNSVVDPFGGVALGGFDAMQNGLNWIGCELEAKFHDLGNKNIALWNERYSRMPNWGSATLLNGDSRKLASVVAETSLSVSSPPYINSINSDRNGIEWDKIAPDYAGRVQTEERKAANERRHILNYGSSDAQLGAMKEGDLSIAISSPPYGDAGQNQGTDRRRSKFFENDKQADRANAFRNGYGDSEGQLDRMSMDGHAISLSSPPYPQPHTSGGGINVEGYRNDKLRPGSEDKPFDLVGQRTYQGRGGDRAEGNLETLDAEGFEMAVSSPPFEDSLDRGVVDKQLRREYARAHSISNAEHISPIDMESDRLQEYGGTEGNIGNQRGETFWSASRTILEQLHSVLTPNAHAVFVVKAFVRNKQIVDFPGQWAQLCEAVGFRLIHDHHALLTEHSGTQGNMLGEDKVIKVERKSFFRRLAEAKGSPRIDYENVLCFERV